jgi:hypothetical protein
MTLLDVEELTRYWIDHPPLHLMVAAYLGVARTKGERTSPGRSKIGRYGDVRMVLAELGPSFATGDVHAGLAPVTLDFAEPKRQTKSAD